MRISKCQSYFTFEISLLNSSGTTYFHKYSLFLILFTKGIRIDFLKNKKETINYSYIK